MHAGWVRAIGWAAAGGFVVGIATSFGQGLLPDALSPLANSSTSWSVAAFVLTAWLGDRDPVRCAVAAGLALLAMLIGYDVATIVRGFPISISMGVFWAAAGLVAGPALGVGAAWVRGRDPFRVAAGMASVAGIAIGEGVYGLTVIEGSTPAIYWTAQIVLAAGAVAWVGVRTRSAAAFGACAVLAAVVAGLFLVVYSSI